MSRLDELLRQARQAEPDMATPDEADRAVSHAAVTGRARHRGYVLRRVTTVTAVSAALAAAAATLLILAPPSGSTPNDSAGQPTAEAPTAERPEPIPVPEQTRLELETGDRLLAAEGARFTVARATGRERLVELDEGTMMFDVRPLHGGAFTVLTDDARVTVLGTVFTVQTGPGGTTVRVYEGRVRVAHGGDARVVTEGGVVVADGGAPRPSEPRAEDDPLAEPAREAARRRHAALDEVPTAPPGEPDPEPSAPGVEIARAAPASTSPEAAPPTPARADPETSPEPPPEPDTETELSAADVRALIADSQAAVALAEARRRTASGQDDPWLMLEADALRALGRDREAAATYARAARHLAPPRRQQAGYLAARLLTGAPGDALSRLDEAGVTAPGSPLRERGLALRVDLLTDLGREAERREAARTYLSLYPDGSRADTMRRLIGPR